MAARRISRDPLDRRRDRATPNGRTTSTTATNPKGLHVERWRHVHGCGRFFNAVRDTVSDFFRGDVQGRRTGPTSRACRAGNADERVPLAAPAAGSIAASRCAFRFDGRAYEGFAGDTLASALIANGVHLVGRSFKYHRPRGIVGCRRRRAQRLGHRRARRCAPARRICGRPRSNSTTGSTAESQNRWPSLAFDLAAVNDLVAPLIPAGFYYKTFMWPRAAWKPPL